MLLEKVREHGGGNISRDCSHLDKNCLINLTLKPYIHNHKAKLNLKINSEILQMKPMNLCIELMASSYKKELIN